MSPPIHTHHEFDAGLGDVIEVSLVEPANVQLLDSANFDRYRRGQPFQYVGGHVDFSPYRLSPPRPGHWHLVIDLGGGAGRLGGSIRVLPAELIGAGGGS